MNRFTGKGNSGFIKKIAFAAAGFFLLLTFFVYGFRQIDAADTGEQRAVLETALHNDIVHCYAEEGRYPESLSYIESHYGLTYDHDKFFIDYQPVGENVMPDVTILEKEGGK